VRLDLADPATWDDLRQSFRQHLSGFAGEVDEQRYTR